MNALTLEKEKILEYTQNYFLENNYWNKTYIAGTGAHARTFRLINSIHPFHPASSEHTLFIPIYGTIAAGYPDYVESCTAIGSLQIDRLNANINNGKKAFALKVRGESMSGIGIYDGDIVIVEPGKPNHNDVVAALIDGETTLKRYIRPTSKDSPYLKSENNNYPNLIPTTELKIQGIVRSVIRSLI